MKRIIYIILLTISSVIVIASCTEEKVDPSTNVTGDVSEGAKGSGGQI